jgi:hypothetical protein
MKTPEPHDTPRGTAVDIGTLYRYETRDGIRYILSGWRDAGAPKGFYITREQLHERIDSLLDTLDADAGQKPTVPGQSSRKWKGE